MKKPLLLLAAAFCGMAAAQNTSEGLATGIDDPVLMVINGHEITRGEFEYSYNKNNADGVVDKKSVEDYVPLFVNFKLKVEAARDAGIDTLSAIRREIYGYREQLVLSQLADSDYIEHKARETYQQTADRFAGQDMLTASHILVLMRQDADADAQAKAKARIDSIYQVLQGGADFAEVARQCSDDKGSAQRGGLLGQFGKGMMIPDFEKAAYALQKGEMSEPVKTTVGWHIIRMEDRHPFESYEYHRPAIMRFLAQRGVREESANALVDSVAKHDGLTRQQVVERYLAQITDSAADQRYLSQEYYDGTLMYEISKTHVWEPAAKDEAGMSQYFLSHRDRYKWDSPRFRGAVLHAKDNATLKRAKKLAKALPESEWASKITSELNTDSVRNVRVEKGLFAKGDNKTVDRLVFKDKTATLKPSKTLPAVATVGKKLKQPETYNDVRGQVSTDYQQQQEQEWVEQLRRTYTVYVDENVLATVNRH